MTTDPWLARLLEEAEAKFQAIFREARDYTFACSVPIEDQTGMTRYWASTEECLQTYGVRLFGHDDAWLHGKIEALRLKQARHPLSRLDELHQVVQAAAAEVEDLRSRMPAL